jgi:hypothetical protein
VLKHSSTALDDYDKLLPMSRAELKRGNELYESKADDRFHTRSHHQERGKQWARDVNSVGRKEKEEGMQAIIDADEEEDIANHSHADEREVAIEEEEEEEYDDCEEYEEDDYEEEDDWEEDLSDQLLKDKPFLVVAKPRNNSNDNNNKAGNNANDLSFECTENDDGECEICNARKYDRARLRSAGGVSER